jgi:hypothetical protein
MAFKQTATFVIIQPLYLALPTTEALLDEMLKLDVAELQRAHDSAK